MPSVRFARIPTRPRRSSGHRSGLRGTAGSLPSGAPGDHRADAGRRSRSTPWRGRELGIAGSGRHRGGPACERLQAADGDALPGRRGVCRRRMEPRSLGPQVSRYRQVRNVGSRRAPARVRTRRYSKSSRRLGRKTVRGAPVTARRNPNSRRASPREHARCWRPRGGACIECRGRICRPHRHAIGPSATSPTITKWAPLFRSAAADLSAPDGVWRRPGRIGRSRGPVRTLTLCGTFASIDMEELGCGGQGEFIVRPLSGVI